ncbi:MAG: hypothetical protein HY547_08255 [Elusimicrobia bacterium]|nr:hypothetical protein [Elusimicrobiota bacterium]
MRYLKKACQFTDFSFIIIGALVLFFTSQKIWAEIPKNYADKQWSNTVNGVSNNHDEGFAIAVDESGNVYQAGFETKAGEGKNIWIGKFDPNGSTLWTATYNGPDNLDDSAYRIALDGSGGIFTVGSSSKTGEGQNIWIGHIDGMTGDFLSTTTLHFSLNDEAYGVDIDSMGDVYAAGVTGNSGGDGLGDAWVARYSSTMTATEGLLWVTTFSYAGSTGAFDSANDVAVDTTTGKVWITGTAGSATTGIDVLLAQLDGQGNLLWTRTYSHLTTVARDDWGFSLDLDGDGNAYVVGWITVGSSTSSWNNSFLRIYSATSTATEGFLGSGDEVNYDGNEYAYDLSVTPSGEVYIVGQEFEFDNPNILNNWVAGFGNDWDSDDNLLFYEEIPSSEMGDYGALWGVAVDANANIYLGGAKGAQSTDSSRDIWVAKYSQQPHGEGVAKIDPDEFDAGESVERSSIAYVAGNNGIAAGGSLLIQFPSGWTEPSLFEENAGYVAAVATCATSVNLDANGIYLTVSFTESLNPGCALVVYQDNFNVPQSTGTYEFAILSATTSASAAALVYGDLDVEVSPAIIGEGSAIVEPESAYAGGTIAITTMTFTAGPSGFGGFGFIEITVPNGWTAPNVSFSTSPGYVAASGQHGCTTPALASVSGQTVKFTFSVSQNQSAACETVITFKNLTVPFISGDSKFEIETSTAGALAESYPIETAPSIYVVSVGEGEATIDPEEAQISEVVARATFTFVAGNSGFGTGGQIEIEIPYGWTVPSLTEGDAGYVSASSTCSVPSVVEAADQKITWTFTEGESQAPGCGTKIYYDQATAPAFKDESVFMIRTRDDSEDSLTDILDSPGIDVFEPEPGEGEASLDPMYVSAAASIERATMTFVAGTSGFAAGGKIAITRPDDWSFSFSLTPGDAGYVSAQSTCNVPSLAEISGDFQEMATFTFDGDESQGGGCATEFYIDTVTAGAEGYAVFTVETSTTAENDVSEIVGSPAIAILPSGVSSPGEGMIELIGEDDEQPAVETSEEISVASFTFTAGASGFAQGGQIAFSVPTDWTPPSVTSGTMGYFYASSTCTAPSSVTITGQTVLFTFNAGETQAAGCKTTFVYSDLAAQSYSGDAYFSIETSTSSGDTLKPILTVVAISVTQAAPGEGYAYMDPSAAAAGSTIERATITFVSGSSGFDPGGRFDIAFPEGWTLPNISVATSPSYVSGESDCAMPSQISIDSETVVFTFASGQSQQSNCATSIYIDNLMLPNVLGENPFVIRTAPASGDMLRQISDGISVYLYKIGEGQAALAPESVEAGENIGRTTVTFTAGASGLGSDGQIAITVPWGWTAPSLTAGDAGYVSVYTTCAVPSLGVSGQEIYLTLSSTQAQAGYCVTRVYYDNVQTPQYEGEATFFAQVRLDGNSLWNDIAAQPSMTLEARQPGEGEAMLEPYYATAGETIAAATFTFTSGGSGFSGGGQIVLTVPDDWATPSTAAGDFGYVTAQSTCAIASQSAAEDFSVAFVFGSTQTQAAGCVTRFIYANAVAPGEETYSQFHIETAPSGDDDLREISSYLSVAVLSAGQGTPGEGEATIAPASVELAEVVDRTTVTFTAGISGFTGGGKMALTIPWGWTVPSLKSSDEGYTYAKSTCSVPSLVELSGQDVYFTFGSTQTQTAGCVTKFIYTKATAQPYEGDGVALFSIQTSTAGESDLKPIISFLGIEAKAASPGEGEAAIEPSQVDVGESVERATITVTAGPSGFDVGGQIVVTFPNGWSAPTLTAGKEGYVSAQSNCTVPSSKKVDGQTVVFTFAKNEKQQASCQTQIFYDDAAAQSSDGVAEFTVETQVTESEDLKDIVTQPYVVVGNVDYGSFDVGEGEASMAPYQVSAGALISRTTITFTAGAGGFEKGGGIVLTVPDGWTSPGSSSESAGYVSAQSNCPFPSTPTIDGSRIVWTFAGGKEAQYGGCVTDIYYDMATAQSEQGYATFVLESKISEDDEFAGIESHPVMLVNSGKPGSMYFDPYYQYVKTGEPAKMTLGILDENSNVAKATDTIVVSLKAWKEDAGADNGYSEDFASFVSTSVTGLPATSTVTIKKDGTGATLYYVSTNTGQNYLNASSSRFDGYAETSLVVLSSNTSFTGVSVDTGSAEAPASQVAISPDSDGDADYAYINFQPPKDDAPWTVAVSSDGSYWHQLPSGYGYGTPERSVYWDGLGSDGYIVPNGTYTVRVAMEGGSFANTSASIIVRSAFLAGVTTPKANVAAYGQHNSGSSQADSSGRYAIYGLKAGDEYYVEIILEGYVSKFTGGVVAVATGTTYNAALSAGARLQARATIGSGSKQDVDRWGWFEAFTNDDNRTSSGYATLHLSPNETISDNGADAYGLKSSSWSETYLQPGSYIIQAYIQGVGSTSSVVAVQEGKITQHSFVFPTRSKIYGYAVLPSTTSELLTVTMKGSRLDSPSANYAYDQADIQVGNSSAPFTLYGVYEGTYTIESWVPGCIPLTPFRVYVGTGDKQADMPTFNAGGVISGTVTVRGDTSNRTQPLSVLVTASDIDTYASYGSLEVEVATSATSASAAYSISGLLGGARYEVAASMDRADMDPSHPQLVTLDVGTNPVATQDLTLLPDDGVIAGEITLPSSGLSASQVSVWVSDEEGDQVASFEPLSTSTFSVRYLGTGNYTVRAQATNGIVLEETAGVLNRSTASVVLDMSGNTYSLSGTVVSKSASPNFTPIGKLVKNTGIRVNLYSVKFAEDSYITSLSTQLPINVNNSTATTEGTFTVPALLPGDYLLQVNSDFDDDGTRDVIEKYEPISIVDANVTGVVLTIEDGADIKGKVSLPKGVKDTVSLSLLLLDDNGQVQDQLEKQMVGNSVSYVFPKAPAGAYVIVAQDSSDKPSYAAASKKVTLGGRDLTGQDLDLSRGGTIVGQLRDYDSNLLLTPSNMEGFLGNFYVMEAIANPWLEGGYRTANAGEALAKGDLDAEGRFQIRGLAPGSYDLTFRAAEQPPAGRKAYAGLTLSGVKVSEAKNTDAGIMDLKTAVQISGRVTDSASGNGLGGIVIEAAASLGGGETLRGISESDGYYLINGANADLQYYDATAAPRDATSASTATYASQTLAMVDVANPSARSQVDFSLTEAAGAIYGRVKTATGKALEHPFIDNIGRAQLFLEKEDEIPVDTPFGNFAGNTEVDGSFTIEALTAGNYTVRALSAGHALASQSIAVVNAAVNIGTITVPAGALVQGTIAKGNGNFPNSSEVSFVVAIDNDYANVATGNLVKRKTTGEVIGYVIEGLLSNITYNLLFFPEGDEDPFVASSNLSVSTTSEKKTLNVTFRPAEPGAFGDAFKDGNSFSIQVDLTQPLRDKTANDRDASAMLTLLSGNGTLSGQALSTNRRTLTALYSGFPGTETSFSILFKGAFAKVNSETGREYEITGATFTFYAGVTQNTDKISNVRGGEIVLGNGDATSVGVPSGGFEGVGAGEKVEVRVSKADSLDEAIRQQALEGNLQVAAYPGDMGFAVNTMAKLNGVTRGSPLVNILATASLDSGKEAILELQYSSGAVSDPSEFNVYRYNASDGSFRLVTLDKEVDTKNRTIKAKTSSFSTYVLLQSQAQTITGNAFTGGSLEVFNFPNPFGLASKTKTTAKSGQSVTTKGTVIRYAIPPGMSGETSIKIYNVAGDLVATLNEGDRTGGSYFYTSWEGTNDAGKDVASGVYFGVLKVGTNTKVFKMAVVK